MPYIPASPEITRWCALLMAIFCLIATAAEINDIMVAGRTGIVGYRTNFGLPPVERVTKSASPAEFHQSIWILECYTSLSGIVSIISFWFYRRLNN